MKTRVAVVYGGRTGEHEVSLRSAQAIMDNLDTEKYKVLHYFISKEGKGSPRPITPEPKSNAEIDVVFPVLHGTFGEDGTVQGLLELADLPYVGAGVLGSAVSMDKEVMKRLAHERGLPVAPYIVLHSSEVASLDNDTLEQIPIKLDCTGKGEQPAGAAAASAQLTDGGFPVF